MNTKSIDVTALGELLVDFTENEHRGNENPTFTANPGGAPCNVLSMLGRLGFKTAFIGKVGDDIFGNMLERNVEEQGIDVSGLVKDKNVHTTLTFIRKLQNGDRDFLFFRNPGADTCLTTAETEMHRGLIAKARIFHFGSLSMTDAPAKQAVARGVKIAKSGGCLISFDPNLRLPLWHSAGQAEEKIRYGLSVCDILKISDNEVAFLTGTDCNDSKSVIHAAQNLADEYRIPLVFVTLGAKGSCAIRDGRKVFCPGFVTPDTVDTTGAGDTFCACALAGVLEHGVEGLKEDVLSELLVFANAAASIITTKKGALSSMPTKEEILRLLETSPENCLRTFESVP